MYRNKLNTGEISRAGQAGIKILLILLIIHSVNSPLFAQQDSTSMFYPVSDTILNNFGLFENDRLIEITLRFDITYFMENKPEDEYLDALLTWHFNDYDSINKVVRLRARGNYRHRTCPFPPIRINLKKSDMGYADLQIIDNIKVVTHCRDNKVYEDYMLKEYIMYKLYNIVTDTSFRVRLLKIKYIDTGSKGEYFSRYAFLLEPVDLLETRLNLLEQEDIQPALENIEDALADKLSLFQFMAGNLDWYLPTIHNLKIFSRPDTENQELVVVPYDFDYSGFVNAEYSLPRDDLGLTNVRERAYIGPCRSEAEWRVLLDEFSEYHDQFIETIREFPYIDRENKKDLVEYVDSFYSLYRRDAILEMLGQTCIDINK